MIRNSAGTCSAICCGIPNRARAEWNHRQKKPKSPTLQQHKHGPPENSKAGAPCPKFKTISKVDSPAKSKAPPLKSVKDGAPQVQLQSPGHPPASPILKNIAGRCRHSNYSTSSSVLHTGQSPLSGGRSVSVFGLILIAWSTYSLQFGQYHLHII
jgi:hypothetical protein